MQETYSSIGKNYILRPYKHWFFNVLFIILLVLVFSYFQYHRAREQIVIQIEDALYERSHAIEVFSQSFVSELGVLKHSLELSLTSDIQQFSTSSARELFSLVEGTSYYSLSSAHRSGSILYKDEISPKSLDFAARAIPFLPVFEGIYRSNQHVKKVVYQSKDESLVIAFPPQDFEEGAATGSHHDQVQASSKRLFDYIKKHKIESQLVQNGFVWTDEYYPEYRKKPLVSCIVPVMQNDDCVGIIYAEVCVDCLSELLDPLVFKYGEISLQLSSNAELPMVSPSQKDNQNQLSILGNHLNFYQPIAGTNWQLLFTISPYQFFAQKFSVVQAGVFLVGIMLIVVIIGYFYLSRSLIARDLKTEKAELETQLKNTELRMLRSQINPHFLFNSLNSIRSLISEDLDRARWGVTQLSSFLRKTLVMSERYTVSIKEEIDCVTSYIEMEKIRFEERIHFSVDCDDSLLDMEVPPMILQGLVENAVKHGVSKRKDPTHIAVRIYTDERFLYLKTTNNGIITTDRNSTHIGKKNTIARIKIMYGSTAGFSLTETNGNVIATILIPRKNTKK